MPRRVLALAVLLTLVFASGCGGGGTSNSGGPVTTGLPGVPTHEGFVSSSGGVVVGFNPFLGDNVSDDAVKGFLAFDLSQIPPGSLINSATLHLHQYNALGTPFLDLGNAMADHYDGGATLDSTDFNGGTIQNNFGTISMSPSEGDRTLDVTVEVQDDVMNQRPRTDLRFHFQVSTDGDMAGDAVTFQWTDPAVAANLHPYILVTFTAP